MLKNSEYYLKLPITKQKMGFLEQTSQQNHEIFDIDDLKMICYDTIGRTVQTALLQAQSDSRLIIGMSAAIKVLSNTPEGSLICLMAQPEIGDSATHMQEVLLEAFCYENDIYVIKVDSAKKMSRILGKKSMVTCCLIQKTWTGDEILEDLTKSENILVDHCEEFWDSPQQPIIKLPAM